LLLLEGEHATGLSSIPRVHGVYQTHKEVYPVSDRNAPKEDAGERGWVYSLKKKGGSKKNQRSEITTVKHKRQREWSQGALKEKEKEVISIKHDSIPRERSVSER